MMHKELTQMSNDLLIEMAKASIKDSKDLNSYRYLTELITRFERLSLGQQADEAIKKAEELQQEKPTKTELEVLKEIEYLFSLCSDDSIDCMGYRSLCEKIKKLDGASQLQQPTLFWIILQDLKRH